MEKDRFSTAIEKAYPDRKELAKAVEAKLVDLYPLLQSNPHLRDKFATHIESDDTSISDHNLVLLTKLGSAVDFIEKSGETADFKYNRYTVVDRFMEQIKQYAAVQDKELQNLLAIDLENQATKSEYDATRDRTALDSHPFNSAILTQDFPYLNAASFHTNDSFIGTKPLEEHIGDITRCATQNPKMTKDLIQSLDKDLTIIHRAMLLLGRVCPKFRKDPHHPDVKKLCEMAESLPRYVFAACDDMLQKGEILTGPQMLEARIDTENVTSVALNLTKEKCDERIMKTHKPAGKQIQSEKIALVFSGRED